MEGGLEHFVIRLKRVYQHNASILATTRNDLVCCIKLKRTCVVDINAVDDALVGVVDGSWLSGLEQMQGDHFAAGDYLGGLHGVVIEV